MQKAQPQSRERMKFMTEIEQLIKVIERLRAEDGCPWDREQTHMSLKKGLIEESAEVICGINYMNETGDASNLKEELGDLLLQVVMHAQIAKEEGLFDMEDICKLVRRHPHVFGDVEVADSEEVLKNWDKIKTGEKKADVTEYLFRAFDESKELIDVAIKRKKEKHSRFVSRKFIIEDLR